MIFYKEYNYGDVIHSLSCRSSEVPGHEFTDPEHKSLWWNFVSCGNEIAWIKAVLAQNRLVDDDFQNRNSTLPFSSFKLVINYRFPLDTFKIT